MCRTFLDSLSWAKHRKGRDPIRQCNTSDERGGEASRVSGIVVSRKSIVNTSGQE